MTNVGKTLLVVAKELAESATNSLPELREGELIKKEWLKDNIYCRETIHKNKVYHAKFDFHRRQGNVVAIL